MMQDRIEPKMRETIPTESVIHNVLNVSFSISMAPMDSSKIQCLWDTVRARTGKIASSTRVIKIVEVLKFLLKAITVFTNEPMFKGINSILHHKTVGTAYSTYFV